MFLFVPCAFFQQTISHMCKRFTEWGHSVGHQWSYDHIHEYMNIMRVNIECFTGCKRIKQRRISFVPGYLRMILWKISTAISIKHRILATFNNDEKKKKNQFERLYSCKYHSFHNAVQIKDNNINLVSIPRGQAVYVYH